VSEFEETIFLEFYLEIRIINFGFLDIRG